MRCYKCNSVLSETDYCNSCGTDVTLYKKIVKLSNTYYNMGLAKARVRDLSGAADILRRSVRIDKKNVKARNLLGLVYYEMGECVAALSEWVISKNIKPEKNVADIYLKEVQSNPTKLNQMNQSIKKYNLALEAAGQGSEDVAVIQLKKILTMNPNFLKAQQLLALLYMKRNENDKAYKILVKAAAIDVNNTLTLKYLDEIGKKKAKNAKTTTSKKPPKTVAELNERDSLSGNDVIIPKSTYREVNYGLLTFLNIVVGIIIGAAMIYFVVLPAREMNSNSENKDTISEYVDKVAMLNIQISNLERQVENLINEKASIQNQLDQTLAAQVDTTVYDSILAASAKYFATDIVGAADVLYTIDVTKLNTQALKDAHANLCNLTYSTAGNHYNNLAYQEFNAGKYETAIPAFEKAVVFSPDNVGLWYNLGKCYRTYNGNKNNEKSIACFNKVIELAPNSEWAEWARGWLD